MEDLKLYKLQTSETLWFHKCLLSEIKACSLSVKLVHFYVTNCRTVKMAVICINQVSHDCVNVDVHVGDRREVNPCYELLKKAWVFLCCTSVQTYFPVSVVLYKQMWLITGRNGE